MLYNIHRRRSTMKEFTLTITSLPNNDVELVISKPTEEAPEPTLGDMLELTMTTSYNILMMMDEATNQQQRPAIADLFNIMASNILNKLIPPDESPRQPTLEELNDKIRQNKAKVS